MLDLQYICDNLPAVAENCRNRGVTVDLDAFNALKQKRGELISQVDKSRAEQNDLSAQIPKEKDPAAKQQLVARAKGLREAVSQAEASLKDVEAALREEQGRIPNMTHADAPIGRLDIDNKVVAHWGEPRKFDFTPLDHVALGEKHGLFDLEAGSRVAGHGFYFLKNDGVMLELSLVQYALQTIRKAGFSIFTTPDLAKDEILEGIGFNPRGPETQVYSIHGSDLSLVGTAEITLGGMLHNQILDAATLPLKCGGLSHCFRTEAGAHGRATRGIYRVHQFTKVEMFAFTLPEQSEAVHAEIVAIEESIFQGLGIPYRKIDTCTGDLGGPAYRKYDLEAWMPTRGAGGEYGEITSASNCTDYQARRLGIRSKSTDKKGTQFVHTLNGTAVACTRAMIAILENYQEADGSITIPTVLRPWMGKDRIG